MGTLRRTISRGWRQGNIEGAVTVVEGPLRDTSLGPSRFFLPLSDPKATCLHHLPLPCIGRASLEHVSEHQLPGLPDEVVPEAVVGLLLHQAVSGLLVEAPGVRKDVVGPQHDPAVADLPGEALALVDQAGPEPEAARARLDQKKSGAGRPSRTSGRGTPNRGSRRPFRRSSSAPPWDRSAR